MKSFYSKNANFNFNLVDENNDPIFLHGVAFSMTLNLFTYTPNQPIYDWINNFILYQIEKEENEENE